MQSSDLKRVSGLWLKDGKKGKFMSGQTDQPIAAGTKLLIFKNDRKESDKQPDYHLFAVGDESADSGHRKQPQNGARGQQRQTPQSTPAPPSDAEIRF